MDETIRALERRLLIEEDFSLVPLLANLYARADQTAPISFWLAIRRTMLAPHMSGVGSTTHSLHVSEQGALNWLGEHLRFLATQGELAGDGVAIIKALDDPAWGARHAFTLYQHRLRDWGVEGCGNCFLSIRNFVLKP